MAKSHKKSHKGDARDEEDKHDKSKKICKAFAMDLLQGAEEAGWEDGELAQLIVLIAKQLCFFDKPKKILSYLSKCSIMKPTVIARLTDEGVEFSANQIIFSLFSGSVNIDAFISTIGESLEQGLLRVHDENTIDSLFSIAETSLDPHQCRRYAVVICDHAETKRTCGKILNTFTKHMVPIEASSFIYDVINRDYFLDLRGSFKSFMKEIPDIKDAVYQFLQDNNFLNDDGEAADSDADEAGNLRDFIDDDLGERHRYNKSRRHDSDEESDGDDDVDGTISDEAKEKRGGGSSDDDGDDDDYGSDDGDDDHDEGEGGSAGEEVQHESDEEMEWEDSEEEVEQTDEDEDHDKGKGRKTASAAPGKKRGGGGGGGAGGSNKVGEKRGGPETADRADSDDDNLLDDDEVESSNSNPRATISGAANRCKRRIVEDSDDDEGEVNTATVKSKVTNDNRSPVKPAKKEDNCSSAKKRR